MIISYRKEKSAPTILIVIAGGATLLAILNKLGYHAFTEWFLYPSFGFLAFSIICLIRGGSGKYDRLIWNLCRSWSAIWSIAFILFFCAPPFSSIFIGTVFAPIAVVGGVNPFLAALAHLLIWACATDILRDKSSRPAVSTIDSASEK